MKKKYPDNIGMDLKNQLIDNTTETLDNLSDSINNSDNNNNSDYSEEIETTTTTQTETTELEENIPTIDQIELTAKEKLYFRMVNKYFKALNPKKIDLMISIVNGKSKISLRLLDWFVTRYSNKYKICYTMGINATDYYNNELNVYISYKAQLKSYKKRYFDPFRRKKKKKFYYFFDKEKTKKLCTTIGQLNFFRWAYNNEIIKYVENHFETIKKSMDTTNKEEKLKKSTEIKTKKTKKIQPITKGHPIKNNIKKKPEDPKIILSFD